MSKSMTVAECVAYVETHLEIRYATENRAYKAGRNINPNGCVNHSVGCAQPSPDVFFRNMNKSSAGWAVNAILGDFHKGEGRIILTMPYKRRPWGVGSGKKGSWNNSRIQWEICEPSGHTYAGGTMINYDVAANQLYFERLWKLLVAWNVYVATKLGYRADTINDHHESYLAGMGGNHADVSHWLPKHGKSMDALRAEVAAILDAPLDAKEVSYQVEVTGADTLNCRTAPSTVTGLVVRTYREGTVLTITKEANGWGYTGAGWVSLAYTKQTATSGTTKEEPEMSEQEIKAIVAAAIQEDKEKGRYATLADVPPNYKPTVQKLMDSGKLFGYNGGKDGDLTTVVDNTILVDETFCRIVTLLDRLGLLATLEPKA